MSPVPPEHLLSDPARPSMAGVNDYWLGGHDHLPADEKLAAAIEAIYPAARSVTIRNSQFAERAIAWAARAGVTRFLDLGAGLPTRGNAVLPDGTSVRVVPTHEAARTAAGRRVRVVYVDRDPMVATHLSALAGGNGVSVVPGDLADTAAVLADAAVRDVLGHGPACIRLTMVLQFMAAARARALVRAYADALAPGSCMVISVPRTDSLETFALLKAGAEELSRREGRAETIRNHSRRSIGGFFAGLEMVPPGVRVAREWRGGMPAVGLPPKEPAYVLAGVGVKR